MKKLLTKIFAGLFVCVSAFALCACNPSAQNIEAYQAVSSVLQSIKEENINSQMFVSTKIDDIQTDFAVKLYVDSEQYKYYNQLVVISMNFIENYYNDLNRVDVNKVSGDNKNQLASIVKNANALKISYQTCVDKLHKLESIDKNDTAVYEGMRKIFNDSLYDFVKSSYNVALQIAQVKDVFFNDYRGLKDTTLALEEKDTQALRDYFVLYSAYDFYKCLFENLEMNDYSAITGTGSVQKFASNVNAIKQNLTSCMTLQAMPVKALIGKEILNDTTGDTLKFENQIVDTLFKVFDTLSLERSMLNEALSNFSLKDFYVKYSCSLNAYVSQEKQTFASNYYNEVVDFYTKYTNDYINYLTQTMKLGD